MVRDQAGKRAATRWQMQPPAQAVPGARERDLARDDGVAVDRRVAYPARQSERGGGEDLAFEPGDETPHLGANRLERRARGPRVQIRPLRRRVRERALPGDVR